MQLTYFAGLDDVVLLEFPAETGIKCPFALAWLGWIFCPDLLLEDFKIWQGVLGQNSTGKLLCSCFLLTGTNLPETTKGMNIGWLRKDHGAIPAVLVPDLEAWGRDRFQSRAISSPVLQSHQTERRSRLQGVTRIVGLPKPFP